MGARGGTCPAAALIGRGAEPHTKPIGRALPALPWPPEAERRQLRFGDSTPGSANLGDPRGGLFQPTD